MDHRRAAAGSSLCSVLDDKAPPWTPARTARRRIDTWIPLPYTPRRVREAPGMVIDYVPVLVAVLFAIGFSCVFVAAAMTLGPKHLSAEKLGNELLSARQTQTTARFFQRYYNLEVLLLDDLQHGDTDELVMFHAVTRFELRNVDNLHFGL